MLYELQKRTPQLDYFKVWAYLAKIKIIDPRTRKISSKILDTVFVGYALDINVERFLVINSKVSEIARNDIIEVKDIVYFENIFPLKAVVYPIPFVPLTSYSSSRPDPTFVEEPRRVRGEGLRKT